MRTERDFELQILGDISKLDPVELPISYLSMANVIIGWSTGFDMKKEAGRS